MYDVLNCTGNLVISDKLKRTIMEVLSDYAFRRNVLLSENTASYSLNTGWLADINTKRWLEDLQLSLDVNFVLGDHLLPVILKTSKVLREKDRNHNHSFNVIFEPDYSDESYSSIVIDLAQSNNLDTLLDKLVVDFTTRVEDDSGTVYASACLRAFLQTLIESYRTSSV